MKRDDLSNLRIVPDPPELPDDFAHRVVQTARAVQRRRRFATRIGAGATVLMLAIVSLSYAPRWPLAHHTVDQTSNYNTAYYNTADYPRLGNEQAETMRVVDAASPDQVADDLVPDESADRQFAAQYNDASWEYDPNWMQPVEATR